jgi:outer membrane protein OmpA-like peptidoglycan-associated protein
MKSPVTYMLVALLLNILSSGFSTTVKSQETQSVDDLIASLSAKTEQLSFQFGVDELMSSLEARISVVAKDEKNEFAPAVTTSELRSLPQIDYELFFEFNSESLVQASIPDVFKLGQALSDDRFSKTIFLIAGNTDSRGTRAYNLNLSAKRAAVVSSLLATSFPMLKTRLKIIGLGEENLKLLGAPESELNRRVQVFNVGTI